MRIAELGEVAGAGGILVKGAAAQDRAEEVRRGGKVCSPARAAYLDLAAGIAGRGEELVIGHIAHGGPVSQLPEHLDEVGADRFAEEVSTRSPARAWCRTRAPAAPPWPGRGRATRRPLRRPCRGSRAGSWGAGRQDLACQGGLGGAEAEKLDDPGAVDGVVEGLPGLEAGEWRLPGVEEQEIGAKLEAGVDPGRVPDLERAGRLAVFAEIDEIRPAGRHR